MKKGAKHSIKSTLLFDDPFWVVIFERIDGNGYSVARHVFGDEPTQVEFHDFILKQMDILRFTTPDKEASVVLKKKNPKRQQRDAKKAMENGEAVISKAHEAMKKELDKNKKERSQISKAEKEEMARIKFALKQEKRKQKHKGR
ncbi:MAG: YjdF family protein [Gammaproteobacteria bacterium]|nr:YjdF family protein [Gammaproteobacteria bacterium]